MEQKGKKIGIIVIIVVIVAVAIIAIGSSIVNKQKNDNNIQNSVENNMNEFIDPLEEGTVGNS